MGRNSGSGGGGFENKYYSTMQIENTLHDYVNGESSEINGWLRNPGNYSITSENLSNIKILDSILKGKVEQGILYRKTEAKSVFGYLSQSEYDKLYLHLCEGKKNKYAADKINGVLNKSFKEKGFMSTSKNSSIAENMDFAVKPIMLK